MSRRSSSGNSNSNISNNGSLSTIIKTPKRRNERNILTFYEKIAVIRYYDETNVSRNSLAKMFHCCTTQIRRILERKHELLQQLATLSEADASIIIEEMTRKRRKFEMSAISFILHQWVQRCRQLQLRKTITNETLKEIALKMAAILNLPTFRPSYRWLNRFRTKYKYNDEDLGVGINNENAIAGELSVEDIIIEFKDALPSFMQKEISTITQQTLKISNDNDLTATSKTTVNVMELTEQNNGINVNRNDNENGNEIETVATSTIVINDNSLDNFQSIATNHKSKSRNKIKEKKEKIEEIDSTTLEPGLYKKPPLTTITSNTATNERVIEQEENKTERETHINPSATAIASTIQATEIGMEPLQLPLTPPSPPQLPQPPQPPLLPPSQQHNNNLTQNIQMMNASTTALFDIVFPHLAIVHQFALLNSDIHALELITKLGVHMQTQAANGAYKQLSLTSSSSNNNNNNNNNHNNNNNNHNNNNNNISNNSSLEAMATMAIATKKSYGNARKKTEADTDIDTDAEVSAEAEADMETEADDAASVDAIYPDIDDIVLLE